MDSECSFHPLKSLGSFFLSYGTKGGFILKSLLDRLYLPKLSVSWMDCQKTLSATLSTLHSADTTAGKNRIFWTDFAPNMFHLEHFVDYILIPHIFTTIIFKEMHLASEEESHLQLLASTPHGNDHYDDSNEQDDGTDPNYVSADDIVQAVLVQARIAAASAKASPSFLSMLLTLFLIVFLSLEQAQIESSENSSGGASGRPLFFDDPILHANDSISDCCQSSGARGCSRKERSK